MRIVDVNEFYAPAGGGVRTYLDRKMAIMAELGHELVVIAPAREPRVEVRPDGGRVIYVRSPAMPFDRNYGLFWRAEPIVRHLDRLAPDVVECSSPWRPAWIVANWSGADKRGGALKSFFMHNDNIAAYPQRWFEGVASHARIERGFAWYTRYMARFLRRFDTVVTNGPALEKRLRARGLRIDAAIPLGVEQGRFSPGLRDEGLRAVMLAELGLPRDATLLLGIGRHHPEKRWGIVIDAVARAGGQAPIGLMLLGEGMETPRLARRVARLPHIRLCGPIHDRAALARIVASADALVHGSESEPFGLVAAEAMAAGLPLVVPASGGCAELADPACAELYAPRDPAACAAAILRLRARDPAALRRAAMAAAGRVRSDRAHAEALIAHYQALLAARGAA